eukprot:1453874-Pyramimonas_sp.AAC.1
MGACSRRKRSVRPLPTLLGVDGKPLASFVEVANRWLQHFSNEEAAPVIPESDLLWFLASHPTLDASVTHNVDINIEDVPSFAVTQH